MRLSDYESMATNRTSSMFDEDVRDNLQLLKGRICNSRVAIIGAAGSIGFSVVKSILRFKPAAMSLIDISENNLVEVVRDCRSSSNLTVPDEFNVLPIGLGSLEFLRFFNEGKPFDYILNLSAMKHVRSEKDIYCLIRMIDTNITYMSELLEKLEYRVKKFFSVSSDKAVNPANLMGASKMVMEKILLNQNKHPFSTARFANVAFSDGSLPFAFIRRIEKRQPISSPRDVRRFFISHEEAGHICLLSSMLGENGDVYFPDLKQGCDERTFSDIAIKLLEKLGYEAYECSSEQEARQNIEALVAKKKWPCFFFDSDTTGEKDYEEFYNEAELVDCDKYKNIGVIKQTSDGVDSKALEAFLQFVKDAKSDSAVTKSDYVKEFKKIVPTLYHVETGKNLDQKM